MKNIQSIRKQHGITQVELCKVLGVSQANLSAWETGRWEPDSIALSKMADYFGVSVDYLLGRTDNNSSNTGLAEHLREFRSEKNLTQKQMGAMLGISQQAYATYENNIATPPVEIMIKLADIFNTTIDSLLGRTSQPICPIYQQLQDEIAELKKEIESLKKEIK